MRVYIVEIKLDGEVWTPMLRWVRIGRNESRRALAEIKRAFSQGSKFRIREYVRVEKSV